jgi:hypothetical protein
LPTSLRQDSSAASNVAIQQFTNFPQQVEKADFSVCACCFLLLPASTCHIFNAHTKSPQLTQVEQESLQPFHACLFRTRQDTTSEYSDVKLLILIPNLTFYFNVLMLYAPSRVALHYIS